MKFDLHTHHQRCGHAVATIEAYITAAIEAGLATIGIADHAPLFFVEDDHPEPGLAMSKQEFPLYIAEVLRLKEVYRDQIEVLLGVESDFFPEHVDLYSRIYQQYPFDYIIGSVHTSNGTHHSEKEWELMTAAEQLREKEVYYQLVQAASRSKAFDILAHLDMLKKGFPGFPWIPTNILEKTLSIIGENDDVIEVNTSGSATGCGWFPGAEILERAHFYGVKVTFGSDSHHPSRVGTEFEAVRQLLREIGYQNWVIFRGRQRSDLPL